MSPTFDSARPLDGRALVVASRYNENVTRKLLEGAEVALGNAGFGERDIDVVWVPGVFELPLVIHRGLATGEYVLAVALGAVIRGETPHFDYVASEATSGIGAVARQHGIPVGFGVLTCETMSQALARAGGEAGNKGIEAAEAAVATARALQQFDSGA
ncbi:MAG: 6,7-dimethyl-8-ribityllumazine synthase [Gemmatimonadales bacterium]